MKSIKYLLLIMSLHIFVCNAQNTSIFYNVDVGSISVATSFDRRMSYCDGYFAGDLQMFMVEQKDTCCLFSSIGYSQFSSSITEQTSDVNVYCWPETDTKYEQSTCEDQPRANRENAELVMNFHLDAEKTLRCTVSFHPEKCAVIDCYGHDIDSVLNYPHYFADNIYEIVCGMFCQGKDKKEVETFIDTFDKRLQPSMLDMKKGYGVKYGHYYGYNHYKYVFLLLKALLHISSTSYVGKDIVNLNKELNRFYKDYKAREGKGVSP